MLSKQSSVRSRVYLSDFSNSTISLNDFSNSFLIDIHIFTYQELKTITQGFSKYNYLGEGGFGEVYKGFVDDSLKTGLKPQPVAVKVLKREGGQGHREWLVMKISPIFILMNHHLQYYMLRSHEKWDHKNYAG